MIDRLWIEIQDRRVYHRVTMKEIRYLVARAYRIRAEDLYPKAGRCRELVQPRHIAMTLCHRLGHSYSKIGREFKANHTSVLHAIRKLNGG